MIPTYLLALTLAAPPSGPALVFEPPDPTPRLGDHPTALAISRDGKRMAVSHAGSDRKGTSHRVILYDTPTWTDSVTLAGAAKEIRQLAFSADGNILFGGGFGDRLYAWDTKTGRLVDTMPVDAGECVSLVLSPNGKYLVSRHTRYQRKTGKFLIQVWDANTYKKRISIHDDEVLSSFATAVTPDSKTLATCLGKSFKKEKDGFFGIVEYDMETGKEQKRINAIRITPGASPSIRCIAYSPDGSRMYIGGGEQILKSDKTYQFSGYLWEMDRKTGTLMKTILSDVGDWVHRIAISSDGKVLFTTAGLVLRQETLPNGKLVSHARGIIRAFDTDNWKPLWEHETEFPNYRGFVLSPAGTRLCIAGDSELFLLDTTNGKKKAVLIEVGKTAR
ncbi:MAG TPA: hypothetical protein VGJ05_12990 [Fimbriiglobus sp.]|jgi:WD40 repeat protein